MVLDLVDSRDTSERDLRRMAGNWPLATSFAVPHDPSLAL
jgi:hypothetical protein